VLSTSSQLITLKEALLPSRKANTTKLSHQTNPIALSPLRDRLMLGATLLQAVLQHHSTTWMPSTWSINKIYLISAAGRLSRTDFTAAFLAAKFTKSPSPQTAKPFRPPFVRNLTLHNLAIVLIELAHGKPIEELMNDEEKAIANQPIGAQCARPQAASRLAEELPDHVLVGGYCKAVNMCLTGNFGMDVKGKELSDHDLFCAVYRMAAKPLMDSLSST
jgi:hypothetical protein